MRINGQGFIGYNDFHIPLQRDEAAFYVAARENPGLVKTKYIDGAGLADVLTDENLEHIINARVTDDPPETAPFHLGTMTQADEGTTISGDLLADLIKRAKQEKVTVASLVREMPNVSTLTMVTPGPGSVDMAERAGGRGRKKPD